MSSVQFVNSKAEILRRAQALAMNINAGKGLFDIMKTNLGPRGTLKMLVGGAGQIKLTKDGNILLSEMQIQHPTASMIARCSTAQDDTVGDGTTSNVLFIGELLKQAELLIYEGIHPRVITEGYELAKNKSIEILQIFKQKKREIDSSILQQVARTSLNTKLHKEWAEMLVPIVTEAVQIIRKENQEIDLHMVEIMHMVHRQAKETRLVRGLVLDHGGRHPLMPKKLKNCFILTLNVSLEYEKTEVHSGFYFSNAEQRQRLIQSERALTDEKCKKICDFKKEVCKNGESFVIINQKGIDPICLEMLANEGIFAMRRAKRRNMERLMLSAGGEALNSIEELKLEHLGWADDVSEVTLGEDKYTFIEGCKNPKSCTILLKGPDQHTIAQLKEAVRDGLRSVKNTIDDQCILPGGGAFEIYMYSKLMESAQEVEGKAQLGFKAFAESVLVIPKILAQNSGYDMNDAIIMMKEEFKKNQKPMGLNLYEFGVMDPEKMGVFDNFCVKEMFLTITTTLVEQLLLCDEILRAGKKMGGEKGEDAPAPTPGI